MLARWLHALLALVLVGVASAQHAQQGRHAYVTIHYEGTARDPEYVLGIRTMMRSLRNSGTPHDLVVLAAESVSQHSRALFEQDGLRVVSVPNIPNPFKTRRRRTYKSHFEFTLNKLLLWNMTSYESVVYLDADNVAMHSLDELFGCGGFCVVYMNPCFFHTGLMVVRPSTAEFKRLMGLLYDESVHSYDGADQGFLTAVYGQDMRDAPLYVPTATPRTTVPKVERLPINYNFNHMYYFEHFNFDLYKHRHFAELEPPAMSIAYPIVPALKPWYWPGYILLDMHWHWLAARRSLGEARVAPFVLRVLLLAPMLLTLMRMATMVQSRARFRQLRHRAFANARHALGAKALGLLIGAVGVLASFVLARLCVPALTMADVALCLFIVYQHCTVLLLSGHARQLQVKGAADVRACKCLAATLAAQLLLLWLWPFLYYRLAAFLLTYGVHGWLLAKAAFEAYGNHDL